LPVFSCISLKKQPFWATFGPNLDITPPIVNLGLLNPIDYIGVGVYSPVYLFLGDLGENYRSHIEIDM
jgi:hypothetical protein